MSEYIPLRHYLDDVIRYQIEASIAEGADLDNLNDHFGPEVIEAFFSNPDNVEVLDPTPVPRVDAEENNAA